MYRVSIKIGAKPSKYWAVLETEDAKGKLHRKEIQKDREATVNSNTLQAMIDAVKSLNKPCMVDFYLTADHIVAAWQNGWVKSWEEHSWKNAKGREVRNWAQWEELKHLLDGHAVRVMLRERDDVN